MPTKFKKVKKEKSSLHVMLEPDLKAQTDLYAEKRGKSLTEVVTAALQEYMKNN